MLDIRSGSRALRFAHGVARRFARTACTGMLALLAPCGLAAAALEPAAQVQVLRLEGPIGPASVDYLARGLARAAGEHAAVVVLQIDTPGGLASSTHEIVRAILASAVPVVAWVGPAGARAASAGTYIVYASHVAAMAPGTNLGAATPVPLGASPVSAPSAARPTGADQPEGQSGAPSVRRDDPHAGLAMHRKIVNDSAASLRALAQLRGRDPSWADDAVREGASLSAEDALARNVVDFIAAGLPALLAGVDGRSVRMGDGSLATIRTAGANIAYTEPDWRTRLLSLITDPSIAYVLLLLGVYGIFIEITTPGFGVPGIAGAVLLLIGLFGLQMLPVSFAGIGLILLGLALLVAEALVPSFGALGIGGSMAFVFGSVLLFDTDAPGFGLSPWLIGAVALMNLALVLLVVRLAIAARSRPVVSGSEELIGAAGEVIEIDETACWVRVHGERWRAQSDSPLRCGQSVRVSARQGLVLRVTPGGERNAGKLSRSPT